MIIQIYAVISEEDAYALCKIGVDHIGIVASWNGNKEKGIVSVSNAIKIIETIKNYGKIATVIVDTVSPKEVNRYIDALHMDILHICQALPESELKNLKEILTDKGVQLMYSIPIKDRTSISEAERVQQYADFIMLDSPFKSAQMAGFIGATGRTHNWDISAEIAKLAYKPVILGGGLSPENVLKAIKKVHPAGVDAKTSLDLPEGSGKKDIFKVKEFVRRVREFERKEQTTDNR